MWNAHERVVFDKINGYINTGEAEKALELARSFRESLEVQHDLPKIAYAYGRVAVALRLCGCIEEAERAFQRGYELAVEADEPVIAAYIQADWSRLRSPAQAKDFLDEAIGKLNTALLHGTPLPDPERRLDADRAFFEVLLAGYLWSLDQKGEARQLIRGALVVLEADTRVFSTRYRQAYFLGLEGSLRMGDRRLRCLWKAVRAVVMWRRWDLPWTYLKGRARKSRR